MSDAVTLMFVGDTIPVGPDPDFYFEHVRPVLQQADLVVGHLESPYTLRGYPSSTDPGAGVRVLDPKLLGALGRSNFHIMTMAHNHTYDQGPAGIEDAIAALSAQGIQTTGAGMNLEEARRPAITERDGIRFGVLQYNCVGPREMWATAHKAGCAYVEIFTHYVLDYASPGGVPEAFTFPNPLSLEAMVSDIEKLRGQVDLLAVGFHKGLVHIAGGPLAMYERPLCRAAIDAGADLIIGNHAHVLRGVEIYKGKPIYHGMSNFVTVARHLNDDQSPWVQRRRKLFGIVPDPEYPLLPFNMPEAKNVMIGVCKVAKSGIVSAGFIPCMMNPQGQPVPLGASDKGREVADYVAWLNDQAGLKASFRWDGDSVLFLETSAVSAA